MGVGLLDEGTPCHFEWSLDWAEFGRNDLVMFLSTFGPFVHPSDHQSVGVSHAAVLPRGSFAQTKVKVTPAESPKQQTNADIENRDSST